MENSKTKFTSEELKKMKESFTKNVFLGGYLTKNTRRIKKADVVRLYQIMEFSYEASLKDLVQEKIKTMPYKDFLETTFWKIISSLQKNFIKTSCVLCGSKRKLEVHHSTYDYHGTYKDAMYIIYILTTLCKDCHSKYHKGVKK